MRKLSLITMLLLFSGILFPQTAPKFVYAEIVGTAKFMSTKVTIEVSFGQRVKTFADNRLKDPKTGKPIVFNSMIDALNFMGKQGWEFIQAYVITEGNNNVYHYLLKKPFSDLSPEEQKAATEE
ncbi:MAG: hypothetical protein KBA43_06560 [Paludibacteraceae bacterium]|nr:hypothetical protein [Paludibacteraceae bacterium]